MGFRVEAPRALPLTSLEPENGSHARPIGTAGAEKMMHIQKRLILHQSPSVGKVKLVVLAQA